jgi:Myo-inositol-1-phosphate synthase
VGLWLEGSALSDERAQEGVFAAECDAVELADDDAVGLLERGAGVGDALGLRSRRRRADALYVDRGAWRGTGGVRSGSSAELRGNIDFKNMLERKRLKSKKISKTQSVTSQIDQGISDDDVHIGPSDHVSWLDRRKWAYIVSRAATSATCPLNVELKLEVWDSPTRLA